MNQRFLWMAVSAAWTLGCMSAVRADYRQKAEEATDYVQEHFYDAASKRYHGNYPMKPGDLEFVTMWGCGVQLAVLADATREDPRKYKRLLYDFTEGLQTYWDPQGPVPGYNAYCSGPGGADKYYDDNEWIVLDFVNAYEATKDPTFLKRANDTQTFVLSGWDDKLGGGIYWKLDHKSKNTCSNGPAAAAALRIAQANKDKNQVEWAERIRTWTNAALQDSDGLYWDNIDLDKKVEKSKWSYNTALMIWTNVLLYQTKKDAAYLAEARRLADASLARWTDPDTGSLHKSEDSPLFTHLLCESLLRLYDVGRDVKYLNAVRREASFAYRYARDPQGGYRDHWKKDNKGPEERKQLILSASAARLFWLLSPYKDVDALYADGIQAAGRGKDGKAELLLRQAVESDPENVEALYALWRVLVRERKTADAAVEGARLKTMASDPEMGRRLTRLGWQIP